MKISEMIEQLQDIKMEHGEIPVMIEIACPTGVLSTLDFVLTVGNPFSRSAKYVCMHGRDWER